MLGFGIDKVLSSKSLFCQISAGLIFGIPIGLAARWIPPLFLLGMLAAILIFYAINKRPELALLGILIATSSIVFEEQLPQISLGVISLHVPDLFLFSLFGLILFRWLTEQEFKLVHTPLDRPLLIFIGVTLLSTAFAVIHSSVEIETARRAIRIMSYYLAFFVVTNLVRDRRRLDSLLNGFFFLATVVSAAMVAQYLIGSSTPLLPGRVEALKTQGAIYEDVTRLLPPGRSVVMVAFITIFCILIMKKVKLHGILLFLQWCLIGIALITTFLRSYWAALIIAFILLATMVKGTDRKRFIGWSLAVLCILSIISIPAFVEPKSGVGRIIVASLSRLFTLGSSKTINERSLQWRYVENKHALRQIISHPLIGLGLGAEYRPYDARIDNPGTKPDRSFIHNGHLWILIDTGLIGYFALLWLSLAFLIRGFRYWRNVGDLRLRGVVLGFSLAYLALLFAAVVNSTFVQWRWTPVIGIIMGINEVIIKNFQIQASSTS